MEIDKPITEEDLISFGYRSEKLGYYCSPDAAGYRLEKEITYWKGNEIRRDSEKWQAYIPCEDVVPIRTLSTIRQLKDFHKGMCDKKLVY
jgi:hypothetical protein